MKIGVFILLYACDLFNSRMIWASRFQGRTNVSVADEGRNVSIASTDPQPLLHLTYLHLKGDHTGLQAPFPKLMDGKTLMDQFTDQEHWSSW